MEEFWSFCFFCPRLGNNWWIPTVNLRLDNSISHAPERRQHVKHGQIPRVGTPQQEGDQTAAVQHERCQIEAIHGATVHYDMSYLQISHIK